MGEWVYREIEHPKPKPHVHDYPKTYNRNIRDGDI